MKQEHKELAEKIIDRIKKSNGGLQSDHALSQIIKDNNLRTSILSELSDDYGLIKKEKGSNYRLTKDGSEFESFGKLEKAEINNKNRKDIEFEKLKTDLEIAKRKLEDYGKTKMFATIGFFTGTILAILKLIEWLMKLSSQ